MAATENGTCSQCGAAVQAQKRACPYCGVPYWSVEPNKIKDNPKPEPKPANPVYGVVNQIDARCILPVSLYQYANMQCSIADLHAAQNTNALCSKTQAIEQARQEHTNLLMQCQNALPYRPAPRPVCKEPKRERKPFENDPEGLAMFVFLLILTIVAFVTGAIVPFVECEETGIIIIVGKAVVCAIFMAIGGLLVFVETQIYKSEVSG